MLFLGLTFFLAACSPALCRKLPQHQQQRFLLQRHPEPLELLTAWEPWPSNATLKVVYGVFTSPLPKYAKQMQAVEETWAKDVAPQKMLVVGVNGTAPGLTYKQAPMCQDGHVTNPGISCKEATLLSTGYKLGADWVVVVGSDNYVFPRNLEQKLQSQDANKAQILGIYGCGDGTFCEDNKTGLCGGGGYAISRGALDKMVGTSDHASQNFIQESMHTAETVGGYWSDQVTSCIARRNDVKEVNLAGLYGWKLCPNHATACDFDEQIYKQKIESSDPAPLTFHYIRPDDMRKLYKMTRPGVGFLDVGGEAPVDDNGDELTNEVPLQQQGKVSLLAASSVSLSYNQQRMAYIRKMNKVMKSDEAVSLLQPQQACLQRRGKTQSLVARTCAA